MRGIEPRLRPVRPFQRAARPRSTSAPGPAESRPKARSPLPPSIRQRLGHSLAHQRHPAARPGARGRSGAPSKTPTFPRTPRTHFGPGARFAPHRDRPARPTSANHPRRQTGAAGPRTRNRYGKAPRAEITQARIGTVRHLRPPAQASQSDTRPRPRGLEVEGCRPPPSPKSLASLRHAPCPPVMAQRIGRIHRLSHLDQTRVASKTAPGAWRQSTRSPTPPRRLQRLPRPHHRSLGVGEVVITLKIGHKITLVSEIIPGHEQHMGAWVAPPLPDAKSGPRGHPRAASPMSSSMPKGMPWIRSPGQEVFYLQ